MVDHRLALGKSGRGCLCYVLKPPKIALVVVSGTRSSSAVDGCSGKWPSTCFQVERGQKLYGILHHAVTHCSVRFCITSVMDAYASTSVVDAHFLGAIGIKCINPLKLFREQ